MDGRECIWKLSALFTQLLFFFLVKLKLLEKSINKKKWLWTRPRFKPALWTNCSLSESYKPRSHYMAHHQGTSPDSEIMFMGWIFSLCWRVRERSNVPGPQVHECWPWEGLDIWSQGSDPQHHFPLAHEVILHLWAPITQTFVTVVCLE